MPLANRNHACMHQKIKRRRPSDSKSETSPYFEEESNTPHRPPPRHKPRLGSDDAAYANRDEPGTPAGGIGIKPGNVLTTTTTATKIVHSKPSADASSNAMDIEVEHAPVKAGDSSSAPAETSISSRLGILSSEGSAATDRERVPATQTLPLDETASKAVEHTSAQSVGISHQSSRMRVENPNKERPKTPSKLYILGASEGEDDGGNTECGSAETETTNEEDQGSITPGGGLALGQLRTPTPTLLAQRPVSPCARRAVWTTYDIHKVQHFFKILQCA